MNDETRNSLSAIRRALYGYDTPLSKSDALENLKRLADKKIPEAMHLLGHALWEVLEHSAGVDRAFALISEAAAMGLPSAMASLGAMYMAGAGCERNFDEALEWYQRGVAACEGWDEFAPRLGRVGLRDIEFMTSFSLRINDRELRAPINVLEKSNLWRLALKGRIIDAQLAMISKRKSFAGITNRWELPFKGYLGERGLIVAGSGYIEKIGFRADWVGVKSEFWMSWSDFPDAGEPIGLGELTSIDGWEESAVREIREAYLAQQVISRGDYFELCLINSAVHEQITLSRAGVEIYSQSWD